MRSARPDSPTPACCCVRVFVPMAPPTTNAMTTNAIQPRIAVLRCRALQRPARAAMLREVCMPPASAGTPRRTSMSFPEPSPDPGWARPDVSERSGSRLRVGHRCSGGRGGGGSPHDLHRPPRLHRLRPPRRHDARRVASFAQRSQAARAAHHRSSSRPPGLAMTAANDVRRQLCLLMAERLDAMDAGLAGNRTYLADVDADIVACRNTYALLAL